MPHFSRGKTSPGENSILDCPVPTLMEPDEVRFLHYLTRAHYRGKGDLVDLGPLAGASTWALASGLGPIGHVHSYDDWAFYHGWEHLFPSDVLALGDDLEPLWCRNIARYADRVTGHKGNLNQHDWPGRQIEIRFVDVAKRPETMLHIAESFLPHLIVGGWLVHQDYVSAECPWIHITIGLLADYFDYCDSPDGGTVCLVLRRPIPPGVIPADFFETPAKRGAELIRIAADALAGWPKLCVRLSEARYLAMKGLPDEAENIVAAVQSDGHDHTGAGNPHAHDWGRPDGGGPPTYQDRGSPRPVKPTDPKPPTPKPEPSQN